MKGIILFVVLSILTIRCTTPLEDQVSKITTWEKSIPSNSSFNTVYNSIIYKDLLIVLDEGGGVIICMDKMTGEEKWRWSDAKENYKKDGFSPKSYLYDDILVIGQQNLIYGIDVNNGTTIWHKNDKSLDPFFSGKESKFVTREWLFEEKIWIYIGDLYTGELTEIFDFDREDNYSIAGNLPLYFEYENKEYVTFTKIKYGDDENGNYVVDQWLHLYNVSDNQLEWVSDTIPLEFNVSGIAGLRPTFHEGKILLANDAIYSYDISDGSLAWKKYYGNSFVLSTHLSADYGRVYGNNASGFMVSLDVHTGQEYFNVSTGGSASRIELNDGKAYISSLTDSGPNRMEIRDAYTGQLIKTIEAPFKEPGNNRNFDEVITVDPETGYIYAADHQQILCFDPEL